MARQSVRGMLTDIWIGAGRKLGMNVVVVYSPDKKDVPAVLFAKNKRSVKLFVNGYIRKKLGIEEMGDEGTHKRGMGVRSESRARDDGGSGHAGSSRTKGKGLKG